MLLLSITLTNSGFEVITTTKGAEAIELVRREKFDVVLIDIVMPDVSGFDVLDKVRSFSSVPIIVFTARTDIAESAIRFGANDSIAKPFDLDKLVEKVRLVLGKDNRG